MKYNLLAPVQQRRSRLALTLTASLIFHGSLVGVAALWPRHSISPVDPPPVDITYTCFPAGTDLPPTTPDSSTPEPSVEPIPVPPLSTPSVVDVDPLPPDLADDLEPTLTTPSPRTVINKAKVPPTSVRPISGQVISRAAAPGGSFGHPGTDRQQLTTRWSVFSKPAYPPALRIAKVQGNGMVHVHTNAKGRVVSAAMAQSTGNSILDETTCQHARAFWSGPANADITVPVTYQLH